MPGGHFPALELSGIGERLSPTAAISLGIAEGASASGVNGTDISAVVIDFGCDGREIYVGQFGFDIDERGELFDLLFGDGACL